MSDDQTINTARHARTPANPHTQEAKNNRGKIELWQESGLWKWRVLDTGESVYAIGSDPAHKESLKAAQRAFELLNRAQTNDC